MTITDIIVCPIQLYIYCLPRFERAVNNSVIAHIGNFFVFVDNFIRLPLVTLETLFSLGGSKIFANELDHCQLFVFGSLLDSLGKKMYI